MELILDEKPGHRTSPESMALQTAIARFASDDATLGQAAKFAGMSQTEFLRELGRHRVPIHYGADDLAEDLRTVELLTRR
jgi:predicted HTH domain antitoxin